MQSYPRYRTGGLQTACPRFKMGLMIEAGQQLTRRAQIVRLSPSMGMDEFCMAVTINCKHLQLDVRIADLNDPYYSCENIVLWRGHFNGTGSEKSVNLSINGGEGVAKLSYVCYAFTDMNYA